MARLTLKPARPAYSVPMVTFTDMAIGYSVDELDDITSRKVEGEGIDGDLMARLIRARRGVARATGQADPYSDMATLGRWNLWGTPAPGNGNRRMAAVGTDGEPGMIVRYVAADGAVSMRQFGDDHRKF